MRSRFVWLLLLAHAAALAFGVAGIAVALRYPALWVDSAIARHVYAFGVQWGGVLANVLGTSTMLVYGWQVVGWRRTLLFFVPSTMISLAAELIGTGTGWPFGNYSYTSGLGFKILGRVPFTIPLSWFTIGFASYLIALASFTRPRRRSAHWGIVPVAVWLLVVWDLVLDPAMAHESLQARFWIWHQQGPYFGMPIINFIGWALTGLAFTSVGHLLWRKSASLNQPATIPFLVYLVNLAFASGLCLATGLWPPVLFAVTLGAIPAAILWRRGLSSGPSGAGGEAERGTETFLERASWLTLRTLARLRMARRRIVHSGHAWRPEFERGPILLAVQHVHHLDDGCALLVVSPRPLHIFVALDWAPNRLVRWVMERLCKAAGWPVIVRPRELSRPGVRYSPREGRQRLSAGLRDAIRRLVAGQLIVVFPEGYPLVDPHLPGRRTHVHAPLGAGIVFIAEHAARRLQKTVPIVPVALRYEQETVELHFGSPIPVDPAGKSQAVLERLAAWFADHPPTIARPVLDPVGQEG